MNGLERLGVHWHITIVVDWKTAAVVSIPIVIRLLMK